MDELVKEELWRSFAVFFFALIFVCFLITKFDLSASFFTLIGVPILITIAHFMIKIYIRRGEVYKPPKLSAKFVARFFVLLSLTFIVLWLMGIRSLFFFFLAFHGLIAYGAHEHYYVRYMVVEKVGVPKE